jgi:hypothetical protein
VRAAASGPSCEAGSPPTAVRNTGLANFACRRPETFRAGLPTSTRGAHEQDLSTPNVRAEFACSVGLPGGPDGPLSTVPISARSSLSSPPQAPAGPLPGPEARQSPPWRKNRNKCRVQSLGPVLVPRAWRLQAASGAQSCSRARPPVQRLASVCWSVSVFFSEVPRFVGVTV